MRGRLSNPVVNLGASKATTVGSNPTHARSRQLCPVTLGEACFIGSRFLRGLIDRGADDFLDD